MDNSPEQDKRIMDYQRKLSARRVDQQEVRNVLEQLSEKNLKTACCT
jgi:hypothetical protein